MFVVSGSNNTIRVLDIPPLSPLACGPAEHRAVPLHEVLYKEGAQVYCELSVLSAWAPLPLRKHRLASLIYWNRGGSGLMLVDFRDPHNLKIVENWQNKHNDETYGVHSGAFQAVEVHRIAIRAGRRFLSRLQRGPSGIEFRTIGYFRGKCEAKEFCLPVPLSETEWDQAEGDLSFTIRLLTTA